MTYSTTHAFRVALEQRLLNHSKNTGVNLDRLRRRVLFERIIARLEATEPGRWVLKGGMALEVRLGDDARLTKDIDLGLRDPVDSAGRLHERIVDALGNDPHGDRFVFAAATPTRLGDDRDGCPTWRLKVITHLAGRPFGNIQIDVSPRGQELVASERLELTNLLDFAGLPTPSVEVLDLHRHAAEKLHAMSQDFGDRENTRVRDLVDVVILLDRDLLDPVTLTDKTRTVWIERDGIEPPAAGPSLPETWSDRYEGMVAQHNRDAGGFPVAAARVERLWADMFGDR